MYHMGYDYDKGRLQMKKVEPGTKTRPFFHDMLFDRSNVELQLNQWCEKVPEDADSKLFSPLEACFFLLDLHDPNWVFG